MKIDKENKQRELKNKLKKYERYGKVKSTHQAPSVTGYENIKLRIKTELMTVQECERLKRITARDTRICQTYLRIIKHNEEKQILVNGEFRRLIKKDLTVDKSILDKLTLTTSKRTTVPHDLKKRYSHCSHNEFQECRDKAIWTDESWRKLQAYSTMELKRPQFKTKTSRPMYPRITQGSYTVRVHFESGNTDAKLWLELRDSLDSKKSNKRIHKRLKLPLTYSPYHENKLKPEQIKQIELVYKSKERQWYAHFIQKYSVPSYQSTNPPAVLGVDLGIKKTAVAVLLTPRGKVIMDELCFIVNKERQSKIWQLNKRIKDIQKKLDTKINNGQSHNQLNVKLSQLRRKRRSITEQELGYAVNQLVEFILQLKKQYNLFVSVGYPKDIRKSYLRGSGSKSHRRQLHKWYYRLFITKLKYKLKRYGFEPHHVVAVKEKNTSNTCSSCNSTNTTRTGQGQFNCHKCKYELDADLNGAKNIAKRLIRYALKPKLRHPLKPKNYYVWDLLTKDNHPIELFKSLRPLGKWLR